MYEGTCESCGMTVVCGKCVPKKVLPAGDEERILLAEYYISDVIIISEVEEILGIKWEAIDSYYIRWDSLYITTGEKLLCFDLRRGDVALDGSGLKRPNRIVETTRRKRGMYV